MRSAILGLMLVSVAATPAQAERFAISCKGKTEVGIGPQAGPLAGGTVDEKIVFVVDEEAQTVDRYWPKDRKLDNACAFEVNCAKTFSADRIMLRGSEPNKEGGNRTVWFDWNRGTGALEHGFDVLLPNGNVMVSHSKLTCVPAPMPKLKA